MVCGLSTRKMRTPCVDPEVDDALELVPQRPPAGRSRSRTGRCPGTSSAGSRRTGSSRRAAAGTTPGAPWRTGGRASTGRRCRARSRARARRPAPTRCWKSSSVPSSGWMALWPPSAAPIAHGLPGIVRAGRRAVVAALAEAPADRVDRRQVEDVEAHRRDLGQPRLDVAERAVASRLGRRGAREQLVPGAEARALAVDDHGQLAAQRPWRSGARRGGASARPAPRERGGQLRRRSAAADRRGERAEAAGVGARSRDRRRPPRAARRRARSVATSWPAASRLAEVARPGREVVHPGARPCSGSGRSPSTANAARQRSLTSALHRRLGPRPRRPRAGGAGRTAIGVVPVGEGDGLHDHACRRRPA